MSESHSRKLGTCSEIDKKTVNSRDRQVASASLACHSLLWLVVPAYQLVEIVHVRTIENQFHKSVGPFKSTSAVIPSRIKQKS